MKLEVYGYLLCLILKGVFLFLGKIKIFGLVDN